MLGFLSLPAGTTYADYLYFENNHFPPYWGLFVVDTTTNLVVREIQAPFNPSLFTWFGPFTVTPDGEHIYVYSNTAATSSSPIQQAQLDVIDCGNGALESTINLGTDYINAVDIGSSGQNIYLDVTDADNGTVVTNMIVIDPTTNAIERTLNLPFPALNKVYISPDEKHAYAITITIHFRLGSSIWKPVRSLPTSISNTPTQTKTVTRQTLPRRQLPSI